MRLPSGIPKIRIPAEVSPAVRRGIDALAAYCATDARLSGRLQETVKEECGPRAFATEDTHLLERLMRAVPGPNGRARRVPRLEVVTLEAKTSDRGGAARPLELVVEALRAFPSAQVFIAPEWLFLPKEGLLSAARFRALQRALEEVTRGRETLVVPGTLAWRDAEGRYHNTALAISNGRTLASYDKCHDGGDAEVARARGAVFAPGDAPPTFRWRGLSVGLEICRDHGDAMLRWALLGTPRDHVDLHLVVSAGVEARHPAAGVGGVVVAVDGCSLGTEQAESHVFRRTGMWHVRAGRGGSSRCLRSGVVARRAFV